MMNILKKYAFFLALTAVLFTACKEDEVIDRATKVAFKEFNGSIASAEESLTIELITNKAVEGDVMVNIGVDAACNAVLSDYIFKDALGNELSLAGGVALNIMIPTDSAGTRFTVQSIENGFPIATEELDFTILEVENAELNDSHLIFEMLVGSGSGFFSNSYSNDFSNCGNFGVPSDFNLFDAGTKKDKSIFCREVDGENFLVTNAFGGDAGTVDAWLVSRKKFDFTNASKAVFTMDVISEYDGEGQLEFLWSSNYCGSGDPSEEGTEWINLTALENQLPEGGSGTEKQISASFAEIVGESGYFAFRYSGATSASSIYYAIDNFNLKEPTVDNTPVILLEEHFDDACANGGLPDGWTSYSVSSDYEWICSGSNRGFSGTEGDYAAEMSNFGSPDGGAAEDWLITPQVDVLSNASISFNTMLRYAGSTVSVLTSSDYVPGNNPNDYSWTELGAATAALDSDESSFDYVASGNVALSGITGNTYFAFKYTATGAASGESSTFRVDDLIIATGGGGGNNTGGTSFSTDFEGCTEDYSIPSNFIEEFLTSKEDRGWGCRSFGIDDSRAVQASAFGGAEGEDNAWLIIDQSFDFTTLSTVNFQFQIYSNFSGPGEVIVQYSTDYSGSGSPDAASWTALNALNDEMPAAGSQTWTPINKDLAEIAGKTVYIAFQYVGASSSSSSSWAIDNLAINDPSAFSGNGGGDNGGGNNGGGTGSTITQFDTDFESCSTDYATPDGFFEEFLTAKEDRGWGCRAFGLDDSRAVQASAFGGAAGEDHSWLIIEDQFDFSAETSVNVLFSMYSNFAGPGEVNMKYSTNYSGSGSPDAASWTNITSVNNAMPAAGSQTWTSINENVAELGGKTVYIAFEFVGANNGASSSWAIDNLAINNPTAF